MIIQHVGVRARGMRSNILKTDTDRGSLLKASKWPMANRMINGPQQLVFYNRNMHKTANIIKITNT